MADISSFAPIADRSARVLILGSIPGIASLQANQYYAHPRNGFWRIVGELIGFDAEADYPARAQALIDAGIALWDVVESCHRPGSLDADIAKDSVVVNDFAGFFRDHPAIREVFFNGAAAELAFRRHVVPKVAVEGLRLMRLPSTSPANAGLSHAQKLAAWRALELALTGGQSVLTSTS